MVFQTLRSFAARMGVPLTAAVLAAPFLVTRAAAQGGSLPSGGSFVGLALQNFTPYHSLTGGLLLGVATAMSMLVKGDVLGISGVVGGVVKGKHAETNRWLFIAGLFTGAAALKTLYPAALGDAEMPMWRAAVAGLLVGGGVTLGNGCTSGHGICGNSRLSGRSMVYTIIFMGTGFVTASLAHSGTSISFATSSIPSSDVLSVLASKILGVHMFLYFAITQLASAKVLSNEMSKNVVTYIDGSLFALGLGVSGMTNPVKVAQFLDVSAGSWDPSLMFVMGSALALNLPLMKGIIMAGHMKKPVLSLKFSYPPAKALDTRLILGGVMFGAGWGLGGACPGPAIVSLLQASQAMVVWNACFLTGIFAAANLFP